MKDEVSARAQALYFYQTGCQVCKSGASQKSQRRQGVVNIGGGTLPV